MGQVSPDSANKASRNIFTRLKDTTSAMLGAFTEVFIRSEGGSDKEGLEIDRDTIKIDAENIKVDVKEGESLSSFFRTNLANYDLKLPDSINRIIRNVIIHDGRGDSALAILIPADRAADFLKGEDIQQFFNIFTSYSPAQELADHLKTDPFITEHLEKSGFEVNDENVLNFAILHEMGHIHCYAVSEDPATLNNLQDEIEFYLKFAVALNRVVSVDQVIDEVYRELPKEHHSDEFAITIMEHLFEPNGDFKSEIENFELPELDIRDSLAEYDDTFEELVLQREVDVSLADMYEELGKNDFVGYMMENEYGLTEDELKNYLIFAKAFDEVQENEVEEAGV